MGEVYKKLLNIQAKLKAPKGQWNEFGKYSYRSCEDILEAVKPIAAEERAVVHVTDTLQLIGDRYYIKATAILIDVETGDTITSDAYAREEETKKGMDQSQITGASSSYARKYALSGLFALDDVKDSDGTNTHDKEPQKPASSTTKPQTSSADSKNESKQRCSQCNKEIDNNVAVYSKNKYGKILCRDCQKKQSVDDDGLPF